jgi:hypothetical protein
MNEHIEIDVYINITIGYKIATRPKIYTFENTYIYICSYIYIYLCMDVYLYVHILYINITMGYEIVLRSKEFFSCPLFSDHSIANCTDCFQPEVWMCIDVWIFEFMNF